MMAAERFEDGGRGRRERRCLVTGEVRPCAELIRFVVSPEGRVLPDLAGDLPGRGLWVAADRAALERAGAKGLFARAARRPVVQVINTLLFRRRRTLSLRVSGHGFTPFRRD